RTRSDQETVDPAQKKARVQRAFRHRNCDSGRLLRRRLLDRGSSLLRRHFRRGGLLRTGTLGRGLVRTHVAVAADCNLALAGLAVACAHLEFSGVVVVVTKRWRESYQRAASPQSNCQDGHDPVFHAKTRRTRRKTAKRAAIFSYLDSSRPSRLRVKLIF